MYHYTKSGMVSRKILYLWLRVGLLEREFQAQFPVKKSGTLLLDYNISRNNELGNTLSCFKDT